MFEILPLIFFASLAGSSLRILLRKKDTKREFVFAILLSFGFAFIVFVSIQSVLMAVANQFCPPRPLASSPICSEFISQFLPFQLNEAKDFIGYFYFFFVSGYVASDLLDSLVFFVRKIK